MNHPLATRVEGFELPVMRQGVEVVKGMTVKSELKLTS